ncbi:hypothetical protein HDU99_001634, partial [Rhizoclosmatium hyalinum]
VASGFGLSGPLPDITQLKDLESLDLSKNNFAGTLNASITSYLLGLSDFNLTNNLLTGNIPAELKGNTASLNLNCFDNSKEFGLKNRDDCPGTATTSLSVISSTIVPSSPTYTNSVSSTIVAASTIQSTGNINSLSDVAHSTLVVSTTETPASDTLTGSTRSTNPSSTAPTTLDDKTKASATALSTDTPHASLPSSVAPATTLPTATPASTVVACADQIPSAVLTSIASGPIPTANLMQKYSGDATKIIATLNKLVPGSLNQLNADQVSSSLFQITEPIRPGDNAVTFVGAPFTKSSNAVVVLITSAQYKFNGLPLPKDIELFSDACSVSINSDLIAGMNGIG